MARADARPFISRVEWRYATTVPHAPHWYLVEAKARGPEFDAFHDLIEAEGRPGEYEGVRYRYLTVDGFDYWTSFSQFDRSRIINRRAAEAAPETRED